MAGLPGSNVIPNEPLGENPFKKDDHRHEGWAYASGVARERLASFYSDRLKKLPPEDAPSKEDLDWHLDFGAGVFDILVAALFAMMPKTDQGAKAYGAVLDQIEKTLLAAFIRTRPKFLSEQEFSFEMQIRLLQRKLYWAGQMLKNVREAKEGDFKLRADKSAAMGLPKAHGWEDIEFLIDDLTVEINIAGKSQTLGYKDGPHHGLVNLVGPTLALPFERVPQ